MNDMATLRVDSDRGALVIIGPCAGELSGLDELLALPGVAPVRVTSGRMTSWKTASAEVIAVSRSASELVRSGRTAVVYLDAHVGDAPPVAVEGHGFVCARLGQILVGLADMPAYVATHGERMAQSLIVESLEDPSAESFGVNRAGHHTWRLSSATMFPGLWVSMCPAGLSAGSLADVLSWFEARRG